MTGPRRHRREAAKRREQEAAEQRAREEEAAEQRAREEEAAEQRAREEAKRRERRERVGVAARILLVAWEIVDTFLRGHGLLLPWAGPGRLP